MGRKKVVDPYDFAALRALSNDNFQYVDKVRTPAQIQAIVTNRLANMERNGEYVSHWFRQSVNELTNGTYEKILGYQRTHIRKVVWEADPSIAALHEKAVMDWYNATPEAQEIYKIVAPKLNYMKLNTIEKDGSGQEYTSHKWIQGDEIKALGLDVAPLNADNVIHVFDTSEGRKELELRRRQPYMEGDVVVLRIPYHGHWDYDPHRTKPRGEARYGSVMSVDTDEVQNWRAGKGSRLINVVWFGKEGAVEKVPEKIIKLESRKGRQV